MKKSNFVRTTILAGSLLLQLDTLCFHSRGAAGDVDLSFDPGSRVNGPLNAVAVQADGKVLIGGEFTMVKGLLRTNLARLNADGSGDATFNSGNACNVVSSLELQSDGKVLVGHYSGISRLNSDGSQDTNFNANVPQAVGSVAVQPDGKVLIDGVFFAVDGTSRYGIARLNADGSLDTSFNAEVGAYGYPLAGVMSIVVQSDGKVLIGGGFNSVNGTNRSAIARLNADGTLDSTFNPPVGGSGGPFSLYVFSIALQPDGKVLIGGNFGTVNGKGIARLNTNGSLDLSFNPGTGARDNPFSYYGVAVQSVVVQSDGKVVIGGDFSTVNGTYRPAIARLNANGSLDNTFNPGYGFFGYYGFYGYTVALQSDGKVFIAISYQIARLNTDGSADSSFDPGSGVSISPSLALQPDGKVLIGGLFTFINGTNRYGLARLNANGSRDSAFIPSSFNPVGGPEVPNDYVGPTAFAVQSDGKVLVAVYYNSCYDSDCDHFSYAITRHNADGSYDNSFEPVIRNWAYPSQEAVRALAVQPDRKILAGGAFFSINGTNRNGIARLNANGSLDNSFNPGTGASGVFLVALQPDGKVLIAGNFTSVNGVARNQIARLNADGSLDNDFNPGTGVGNSFPDSKIRSVVVQSDGRVLIAGDFTTFNGTNRNGIARLNANGSLDLSFNPGTGANGPVLSLALQSDGKVLIGGDFTAVNGVVRPYVARLYGDSAIVPSLNIARSNASVIISWPATALNFQLQENTDLSLPNSWSPVPQPALTSAGQISVTAPTTVGSKFFRLKSQ